MNAKVIGVLAYLLSYAVFPASIVSAEPELMAGFVAVPQVWTSIGVMAIAPSRNYLTSTSAEAIDVVELSSGTILRSLKAEDRSILDSHISADSTTITANLDDHSTRAWDASTGRLLPSVPQGILDAPNAALKPSYSIHWSNSTDGDKQIERLDISNGSSKSELLHTQYDLNECGGEPISVVFDGRYLVYGRAGGEGGGIFLPAVASEVRDGALHELWRAPCAQAGHDGVGMLIDGTRFLAISQFPVGPVAVWDIPANRLLASFTDSDGTIAITPDAKTIVASGYVNDKLEIPIFEIRDPKGHRTFQRPAGEITNMYLSPNARWLLTRTAAAVVVRSMMDGREQSRVASEDVSGVTNEGVPIPAPKTPRDERLFFQRDTLRTLGAGDGRVREQSIVDRRTGHRVASLTHAWLQHVEDDGRALLKLDDGGRRLVDLRTGRTLWTLYLTNDVRGYVMTFPDGCVEVSPGSERYVSLVRGFEHRPYDDAAARVFGKPACTGRNDAMAANEASFEQDVARLKRLDREDEADRVKPIRNQAYDNVENAIVARRSRDQKAFFETCLKTLDRPMCARSFLP